MEQSKIDIFLATNSQKFHPYQLEEIRSQLSRLDDSKGTILFSVDFKDPTTLLIISILAGPLGIDRFMLNDTMMGVLKLLTCGGLGIWTIVDWFLIQNKTKDYNFQLFMQTLASY